MAPLSRAALPALAIAMLFAVGLAPYSAAAQDDAAGDTAGDQAAPGCVPLLTVDAPTPNARLTGAVTVRGWAVDLLQPTGSGIDAVHLYLDAEPDNGGLGLGVAQLGIARPDVDAALGRGPSQAGWQLAWNASSVGPGPHTLFIYEHAACGWSLVTVPVTTVLPPPPPPPAARITVDAPVPGGSVLLGQTFTVSGWAADSSAATGTGIDAVHVYLDGQAGGTGIGLGVASYGVPRPDVAAALGRPGAVNSGYVFNWRVAGVAPGSHTLFVYAHSPTGTWQFQTVQIIVVTGPVATPGPFVPPVPVPAPTPIPPIAPTPVFPPTVVPVPVPTQLPAPGPTNIVGYPRGSSGYTISYPQCATGYPAAPYAFGIIGVEGGRSYSQNACLASQWTWARAGGSPPQVYMNTSNPGLSFSANGLTGPAGTCAATDESCIAYNFGYNNATYSLQYARAQGVTSSFWWLDVETENSWSDNTAANARTIQGALDALRAQGITVGVYSTAYQWGVIAGSYSPGLPLWTAGPQSLAAAQAACSPASAFGGGTVALVSYFTGTYDSVYAC